MKKKRVMLYFSILLTTFMLVGCSFDIQLVKDYLNGKQPGKEQVMETEKSENEFRALKTGEYDSADTAVIDRVDTKEKTLTLLNTVVNKIYTLSYDGTTFVTDQFGSAMTMEQLEQGDVVDVYFRRGSKQCISVTISPNGWKADDIAEYELNISRSQITFRDEVYNLADRMVVSSAGEEIGLEELNPEDVLTINGIGNVVYGISVKDGHGYLRLTGDDYFIGGWIEVGQKIVTKITDGMMLTVPEGTYQVVVRHEQHGGAKEVTVNRGEETVLDVEDLKGEEIKTGNVFFTLMPPEASVYIDGEKVDTSTYVTLEYGIHQMIVTADGYETITQYLRVGQENANLNVEMEAETESDSKKSEEKETKKPETSEPSDEDKETEETDTADQDFLDAFDKLPVIDANGETESTESTEETKDVDSLTEGVDFTGDTGTIDTTSSAGTYSIKVGAPEGAEVYVDGNYVGICPVSFPKVSGKHVISLRKSGYQTRSYTIQVDEQEKDMELSFSELVVRRDE